jgi:hypothetical protein
LYILIFTFLDRREDRRVWTGWEQLYENKSNYIAYLRCWL